MKNNLIFIGGFLLIVAFVAVILYGMRLFSNVATPITVHQVEPGIKCATMVTGDGAAISCWKQ